jgi:hypothetical protein
MLVSLTQNKTSYFMEVQSQLKFQYVELLGYK